MHILGGCLLAHVFGMLVSAGSGCAEEGQEYVLVVREKSMYCVYKVIAWQARPPTTLSVHCMVRADHVVLRLNQSDA